MNATSDSWSIHLEALGAKHLDGRVVGFTGGANNWQQAPVTLCDLSHYGTIEIGGDDAAAFLHAQLTNDVVNLAVGSTQLNAWCSPKGRMLAVFTVLRQAETFLLMLPRNLQPAIQKRLQMFVLRSKVSIRDASADHIRLGIVANTDNASALNAELQAIPTTGIGTVAAMEWGVVAHLSTRRRLLLVQPDEAVQLWSTLTNSTPCAGATAWDLGLIRDGVIELGPSTQDQYVPQMANLDLVGGLSFRKGCYPGQEIVARTQYRGILKRRMIRVSSNGANPVSGQEIYSPQFPGQAAGSVALYANTAGETFEALVVTQLESIRTDAMYLDPGFDPVSKLEKLDLPYQIPD